MQDWVKPDLLPSAQQDLPRYSVDGCNFANLIIVDQQGYAAEPNETINRVEARNVY